MSVLHISALQISPRSLINFDTFEQSLEVSSSKALVVASLNDLNKDCWTILDWFGEYLQEVAVVVVVNQDLELLQGGQVLLHLHLRLGQPFPEEIVIAVRNVEKLLSSGSQVGDGLDDIMGPEVQRNRKFETNVMFSFKVNFTPPQGDMLNSSRSIEVHELLDLGLLLPRGRLIDRHLDGLLVVGDDHGAEGGVLGVDLRVVDRPEPVEQQVPLVPPGGVVHVELWLVSHDVVDVVDLRRRELSQQRVPVQRGLVAFTSQGNVSRQAGGTV